MFNCSLFNSPLFNGNVSSTINPLGGPVSIVVRVRKNRPNVRMVKRIKKVTS